MSIQAPENQCHEDMTRIRGGKCHKFEYKYAVKALIKPRVVGNSMYFAPNIATLGSHDFDNVINNIAHT